jgi:hypothetical protein
VILDESDEETFFSAVLGATVILWAPPLLPGRNQGAFETSRLGEVAKVIFELKGRLDFNKMPFSHRPGKIMGG